MLENSEMSESPQPGLCALEYSPQFPNGASSQKGQVILLVLKDREGNLRFLLNPEWRNIVQDPDLDDVQSLLEDFHGRAQLHPANLFDQLCSLAVGPLVAGTVGASLRDYPNLEEFSRTFQ
jgi:hypothetical protein